MVKGLIAGFLVVAVALSCAVFVGGTAGRAGTYLLVQNDAMYGVRVYDGLGPLGTVDANSHRCLPLRGSASDIQLLVREVVGADRGTAPPFRPEPGTTWVLRIDSSPLTYAVQSLRPAVPPYDSECP